MKGVTYDLYFMIHLSNSLWFDLRNDEKIPESFTKQDMDRLLKVETPYGSRAKFYKRAPYVIICMTKGMSIEDIGKKLKLTPERARQLCCQARDYYRMKWRFEKDRDRFPQYIFDLNLSEKIYRFLSNYLIIRYDYPISNLYEYSTYDILRVPGIGPYHMECIQKSLERVGLPRLPDDERV